MVDEGGSTQAGCKKASDEKPESGLKIWFDQQSLGSVQGVILGYWPNSFASGVQR